MLGTDKQFAANYPGEALLFLGTQFKIRPLGLLHKFDRPAPANDSRGVSPAGYSRRALPGRSSDFQPLASPDREK